SLVVMANSYVVGQSSIYCYRAQAWLLVGPARATPCGWLKMQCLGLTVQFGGNPEDVVAQKSIQTFAGGKLLPAATRAVVLLLAVKVFEAPHQKVDVFAIRVDDPAT